MSFYCWFEYKGIIKEEYRDDIEKAVNAKSWAAVESEKLRTVLSEFMELDNEDSVLNRMFSKCLPLKRAVSYDKETGVLFLKHEYNAVGDAWQTDNFAAVFLPFITREILIYNTGDEGLKKDDEAVIVIDGDPCKDDSAGFKLDMIEADRKNNNVSKEN